MHQKAIQILKACIGIKTNKISLLPSLPCSSEEIHSLLTDFHEVKKIEYSKKLDGEIQTPFTTFMPALFLTKKKKFSL